jgi:arylsulfatase A-like enzyme/Tfp pilus assembly protein PilF
MADNSRPEPPPPPAYVKRLRRWRFALILVVLFAAVVAAAATGWRFARTSSAPSNGPIILISIDTLRADHLPLYGYRNVRTPAIDALAAEGVVFERAYAHSPQTLPSHVSLLSGQLPFETGVRDEVGFAVRPTTRLLPQLLKTRWYASGAVVSSYLLRRETGLAQGFDFYDGEMAQPGDGAPAVMERPGPDSVVVAQKWIASLSTPRFFLFLHIDEPHAPYAAPARFAQYAPYDGEIAYADEIVGRFLRWLKGKGLYDRATIVLLSDHGEGLGDHGEQEHGLFLYDETVRIPLVVKLPRDVNHGHRVAVPVQHIDLVPTILDLLDMPKPAGLRGRSLRALLEGHQATPAPQPFYAESFCARYRLGWSGLRALTDGTYRFVKAPREELYDLAQDPAELTNVLDERAATAQTMRTALDQILGGAADEVPGKTPFEEREHLASLGYMTEPRLEAILIRGPFTDPKDQAAVYEKCRQALDLAGQHKDADAAAMYREALAQAPAMPGVWLQFAGVMERAGRVADAVEAFRQVVKLSPAEPAAVLGALGAARGSVQMGKLDEAKAQATLAVKQAPAAAHALLARIALARNDSAGAKREADLAYKADPTLPMPSLVRAMGLHKAGKYEEALPLFEEVARAVHDDIVGMEDVHFYLADTLTRLERYPDAETHFTEQIHLFPRSLSARTSLAMLYRAQHRNADARRAIEDLLSFVPTPEGYTAAAHLWAILGDKDRAAATRADAKERFGPEANTSRAPK